jgi:hypothetical protein
LASLGWITAIRKFILGFDSITGLLCWLLTHIVGMQPDSSGYDNIQGIIKSGDSKA